MSLLIEGRELERVLIVDDEREAREAYCEVVEDIGLTPVPVTGPVDEGTIGGLATETDVVLCDYHLKRQDYATFDGDVLLARCVEQGIAGLLCTGYSDFDTTIRRDCLRWIPARLRSREAEPREFIEGWEQCLREMAGLVHPNRRPWRTLVRVVEVETERRYISAVVPAWSVRQVVKVHLDSIPREFLWRLSFEERFFCKVNIGAEREEDLFFEGWEVAGDDASAEHALHT